MLTNVSKGIGDADKRSSIKVVPPIAAFDRKIPIDEVAAHLRCKFIYDRRGIWSDAAAPTTDKAHLSLKPASPKGGGTSSQL